MRGLLLFLAACGGNATNGSPTTQAGSPGSPDKPATASCDSAVPDRACPKHFSVRVCKDGDKDRIGEWRYAIAAPPFSTVEDISTADLATRWKAGTGLTATADAIEALAAILGPAGDIVKYDADKRPDVTDKQWALIPADELLPNW